MYGDKRNMNRHSIAQFIDQHARYHREQEIHIVEEYFKNQIASFNTREEYGTLYYFIKGNRLVQKIPVKLKPSPILIDFPENLTFVSFTDETQNIPTFRKPKE